MKYIKVHPDHIHEVMASGRRLYVGAIPAKTTQQLEKCKNKIYVRPEATEEVLAEFVELREKANEINQRLKILEGKIISDAEIALMGAEGKSVSLDLGFVTVRMTTAQSVTVRYGYGEKAVEMTKDDPSLVVPRVVYDLSSDLKEFIKQMNSGDPQDGKTKEDDNSKIFYEIWETFKERNPKSKMEVAEFIDKLGTPKTARRLLSTKKFTPEEVADILDRIKPYMKSKEAEKVLKALHAEEVNTEKVQDFVDLFDVTESKKISIL